MVISHNAYEAKTHTDSSALSDSAFTEIYERYYKRLYNYMFYRIGNHHDAEDLVSVVFESVINKYSTFNSAKAPFEVWLFSIARNASAYYFRKKTRVTLNSITEDTQDASLTPEANALSQEMNRILAETVLRLPKKERNIVALKYAGGLKNTEISQITGISTSNVGVILHRALKKLGVYLDELL